MHVMLDLETMGTRPDAPIIAIGAVAFVPDRQHKDGDVDFGGIVSPFYLTVDLGSAVKTGAVIEPSTVMWWMKQSDEARGAFDREDAYTLTSALAEFQKWIDSLDAEIVGLWGNGATFDNVILRQSYYRTTVPFYLPFWADKCYRTVKGMYPQVKLERTGTHHNALDDARTQALHLLEINRVAGGFL